MQPDNQHEALSASQSPEFLYLKAMFPQIEERKVLACLEECGGDAEAAIDSLLSLATIEEIAEQQPAGPSKEEQALLDKELEDLRKKYLESGPQFDPKEYGYENEEEYLAAVLGEPLPNSGDASTDVSPTTQQKKMTKPSYSKGSSKKKSQNNSSRYFYASPSLKFDQSKISLNLLEQLKQQFGLGAVGSSKTWLRLSEDAARLAELTKITEKQARSVMHKNKGDFYRSLVVVVRGGLGIDSGDKEGASGSSAGKSGENENSSGNTSRESEPLKKIDLKNVRRVQGAQKSASGAGTNEKSNSFDVLQPIDNNNFAKKTYQYFSKPLTDSEKEQCMEKLESFFDSNIDFHKISDKFYKDAIGHFNGNVDAIILVACVLITENKQDLTHLPPSDLFKYMGSPKASTSASSSSSSLFQLGLYNASNSYKGPIEKVTTGISASALLNTKYSTHTTILDLHGLTIDEAHSVLEPALSHWWLTEMGQREHIGTVSMTIRKAVCVAPLRVVTGRGVHSVGGYSVLRAQVRKYLTREGYVFEEGTGNFEVTGKKL